jgi:hypothetical protein
MIESYRNPSNFSVGTRRRLPNNWRRVWLALESGDVRTPMRPRLDEISPPEMRPELTGPVEALGQRGTRDGEGCITLDWKTSLVVESVDVVDVSHPAIPANSGDHRPRSSPCRLTQCWRFGRCSAFIPFQVCR